MDLSFLTNIGLHLQQTFFGSNDYLKEKELTRLVERTPFSSYLNYVAYDPKTKIYLNQDNSLGMLWECSPLVFAGPSVITNLEGLFGSAIPDSSVIQVILHGDSHIAPFLEQFDGCRTRRDRVVEENTARAKQFLEQSTKGMEKVGNIPLRNFRLFVALTIPGDAQGIPDPALFYEEKKLSPLKNIQSHVHKSLRTANLSPVHMGPKALLEWLRRLLNHYPEDYPDKNFGAYSDEFPLRKQIINGDTVIKDEGDHIVVGHREGKELVGDRYFFCTTPKVIPKEVDSLQTNNLFGGVWGVRSDQEQYQTDFLYTLNIIKDPTLKGRIHTKCNLLLNQQAVGSLSPSLKRKQEEFLAATDAIEGGETFVRIIPILWVWDRDRDKARDSIVQVRKTWENKGYVMQEDHFVAKILFILAFPFCVYLKARMVENLERDFVAPLAAVTPIMPVQGDFSGSGGDPKLVFTGRKGQLAALDFFHRKAENKNVYCCATSGAGKSFLINYITYNYYACNCMIRLLDLGGSYKKMAYLVGAKYLDFQSGTDVCLNPYTHIRIEDAKEELKSVVAVFAQMAYSNSDGAQCDDTEMNMMRLAVRWAWEQKKNEADADDVYRFLLQFPHVPGAELEELADNPALIQTARKLAFNIREFTSQGFHGKYFIGPSTLDIAHDEFVVLELEHLKNQPDLYRVITLLMVNAVTQDLYLSDTSRQRMVIFEEAWQFLDKSTLLAPVVAEGYRRARKYNGSFLVVTQSPLDFELFPEVGTVIKGNSAFKMYLSSKDFAEAENKGLLDYDEFTMSLLKEMKSNPPYYSEIFFDTPFGMGITRLVVNDYAYFIYTSKPEEIGMIEERLKQGKSYHEAILEMMELRKLDVI
jgi:conjugal transfer ATP-binding protein TraC